jgi:hypothetical protein
MFCDSLRSLCVRLLVIGLHIVHLKIVVMVLLSSDASAAVADLPEGVVEVAAVETHPVCASVALAALITAGFPHAIER